MKKTIISVLTVILVIIAVLFWFYHTRLSSSKSNISVFLGSGFEMPIDKVRKVLGKYGAKLTNADSFKMEHPQLLGALDFVLSIDNEKFISMYMPPINMFESSVAARFSFEKNQLICVDLVIHPLRDLFANTAAAIKQRQHVFKLIISALKRKYTVVKQETSTLAQGEVHIFFMGKYTRAIFRANISKLEQSFTLSLKYIPFITQQKEKIKVREANAL